MNIQVSQIKAGDYVVGFGTVNKVRVFYKEKAIRGKQGGAVNRKFASAGSIAVLVLALIAGCTAPAQPTPTPDIRICEGCGTRWETPNPEPNPQPIKQCPNCPMTPEEFERLKEQLRKSKKQ